MVRLAKHGGDESLRIILDRIPILTCIREQRLAIFPEQSWQRTELPGSAQAPSQGLGTRPLRALKGLFAKVESLFPNLPHCVRPRKSCLA